LTAQTQPPAATPYQRLRNLEKIYLALAAENVHYEPEVARLKRWIDDPRSYAFYAETNERAIIELAHSTLDKYRCTPPGQLTHIGASCSADCL
jgi:hypothetical protein